MGAKQTLSRALGWTPACRRTKNGFSLVSGHNSQFWLPAGRLEKTRRARVAPRGCSEAFARGMSCKKGPIRPILTRGTNNLKKTPKPRHWYLGRASIDAITTLQTRRSNSIVGARNAPLNMGSCVKFDFKTENLIFSWLWVV